MDVKPIKNESDYDAALAEIADLMDARANTPEGDRLDVLATLVEAYEERHWRVNPPDPIEAIKLRMQQRGLSRHDLERVLGSKSRVSEVLNRKRPLTVEMIRRLHGKFGIPAESLIQPTTRKARQRRRPARAHRVHSIARVGSGR
jgi:HTH-type transcriptional regulator/antitoxin HigA